MKVFITRSIAAAGLKMLTNAGHTFTQHIEKRELSQEELITACREHDALLSAGFNKIDAYFLEECQHLKGIALLSVGYDNVDIPAATKLQIANRQHTWRIKRRHCGHRFFVDACGEP